MTYVSSISSIAIFLPVHLCSYGVGRQVLRLVHVNNINSYLQKNIKNHIHVCYVIRKYQTIF